MKSQKKNKNIAYAQDARRKTEIAQYGKLLSLRPSICHKSKKTYDRKNQKKELSSILDSSYCFSFYLLPPNIS